MNIDLSDKLIKDFREKVNGNYSFVYNQYHDQDGKNNWHLICSCMDWISVSVRYLSKIPRFSDDIDVKTMQVYSIISSIDIIYESVSQLHRVFKKDKNPPFYGDDRIFNRDQFDKDDNNYFKEIRSCFGAHPVNLKNDSNTRRFASWPFKPFSDIDSLLEIRIYDGKVGVNDTHFGIKKQELIQFLLLRYSYLDELIVEIERQFQEHTKKLSRKPIRPSSSIIEELEILLEESKSRFNNEYYNHTIIALLKIFTSTCRQEHLVSEETEFKERLQPLIVEVRKNLQKAVLVDLNHDDVLNPKWFHCSVHYELSKFFVWLEGHNDDPLIDFYFKRLNEFSHNEYSLSIDEPINVTFLKSKLLLQRINQFS